MRSSETIYHNILSYAVLGQGKGNAEEGQQHLSYQELSETCGANYCPAAAAGKKDAMGKKENFLTASGAVTLLLGFEDEESG